MEREMNHVKEIENNLRSYLNQINASNTNLFLLDVTEKRDEDNKTYYILSLAGGLNGRGKFLFYMEDVSELVKKLMIRFSRVWLLDWINDCIDDVFNLRIGVRF